MTNKKLESEFARVIADNQGIIHKMCSMYCDSPEDREDLFQEIVLQVWKSYPSFKGNSKISTWIYRVGLNTAISSFRKKKRQLTQQSMSIEELQIPDRPFNYEFEERLKYMHEAIRQLNNVEKAIVMLYLEEHSYQDIAEIMGITESNVGVKLHRIKSKLKKMVRRAA
ncbi:MAG: RNA polymerase sigma factor [Chitinophagales bacterium]